jgi:hypothetical protein
VHLVGFTVGTGKKRVKIFHNKWPHAYCPFLSWDGYNGVEATGKVKVKWLLCTVSYLRMKMRGATGGIFLRITTTKLDKRKSELTTRIVPCISRRSVSVDRRLGMPKVPPGHCDPVDRRVGVPKILSGHCGPVDRRLGVPKVLSGHCGGTTNTFPCPESNNNRPVRNQWLWRGGWIFY